MSVKALFQHHRRARPGAADDALAINAQTLEARRRRRPAAFWWLVTLLALVALAAALLV